MRRIGSIAAATAVIAGVGAGTAPLGAYAGAPAEQTLVIVQRAPEIAFIDLGEAGPTAGDVLVFRSALFDSTNTDRVGELHITCTQTIGPENLCRGVFRISGRGRLSMDALPTFPNPTKGIVNGGTGAFRLARGSADIEPQADGTTVITFHLSE